MSTSIRPCGQRHLYGPRPARFDATPAIGLGMALALLLLSPLQAQSPTPEPTTATPASDDMSWQKQSGDFAAILVLTRQGDSFRQAWNQPSRPDYRPEIRATEQTVRHEDVEAVVLFSGCQADAEGRCEGDIDFKILRPDGSADGETVTSPLWSDGAPPTASDLQASDLQLSPSSLLVTFEDADPLGVYRLTAQVCDTVAEQCVNLERQLEVVEPTEAVDFNTFMDGFYLDPRPQLIEPAMRWIDQNNVLANGDARAPVIAFFGLVMAAYPQYVGPWTAVIDSFEGDSRATFQAAANLAKQPGFLLDNHPPSPGHNDMLWGAFFATGDATYLRAIVDRLAHLNERTDLNLFLTAASAQWSLSSNASGHLRVQQTLQELLPSLDNEVSRRALDNALKEDPASFRGAMMEVIQEQKEAGVW